MQSQKGKCIIEKPSPAAGLKALHIIEISGGHNQKKGTKKDSRDT